MENKETKNKDKAAFPAIDTDYFQMGLTKREYFAIKALQGICVNAGRNGCSLMEPKEIAKKAIKLADGLIDELED